MRIIKKQFFMTMLIALTAAAISFPVFAAKVSVPENIRWDGTRGCWDEAEDAYQYQVQLYKNGIKQKTAVSTSSTSLELSGYMREKGSYTFRVRVRDRISDEYGQYSSASPACVQEKDLTVTQKTKRTTQTQTNPSTGENPGPGIAGKGWQKDDGGWWFRNEDGTCPANIWKQVEQDWYYFDAQGYLRTGWLLIDGKQYYSHADGKRAVGWIVLDNAYYFFDENGITQNHPPVLQ